MSFFDFAGFYAGLVPAMVGITPQMGLNFAFYETFRAIAMPEPSPLKPGQTQSEKSQKDSFGWATLKKGVCGGAAGGLSKLIVYPLVSSHFVFPIRARHCHELIVIAPRILLISIFTHPLCMFCLIGHGEEAHAGAGADPHIVRDRPASALQWFVALFSHHPGHRGTAGILQGTLFLCLFRVFCNYYYIINIFFRS